MSIKDCTSVSDKDAALTEEIIFVLPVSEIQIHVKIDLTHVG